MKIINDEYVELPVDSLHPHPQNPNRGDLAAIAESVDINGFYGAVTVRRHPELGDGQYQILAGEHRWKTARNRGAERVPCIVVRADDDVAAVRVMLGDNEIAKRSTYDAATLSDLLGSLGDIRGTGFDLAAIDDFEEERRNNEDDNDGDETEFVREYGVVLVCPDEATQREVYETTRDQFPDLSIRLASI